MTYTSLKYDVDGAIATITLCRPDALNAITPTMLNELLHVLGRVDDDDAVRAVIVTGAGRAFCAGADLSDGPRGFHSDHSPAETSGKLDYSRDCMRDGGGRITLRLFRCLKPIIAAINGPAVGVGATMTLATDVRLASDAARIGFVFARRGIVPEAASSWFLPRIVGISQALEWCYSGEVFDAHEALRGGLIRSVHAPDDLLPAARALAATFIEASAPVSIALLRQMMWRGLGMADPMEAHRVDSRGIASRTHSADAAEGVSSFFEKRCPSFPDRVSTDMPDFFPWWQEQSYS